MAVTPKAKSQRGKIDPKKLEIMYKAGVSQVDIADTMGVTKQAVNQAVARFEISSHLKDYKDNKCDILESKQADILLHALTTENIKSASLQQAVTAFGILDDKIRLERGQATSISTIDIRQLIASVQIPSDIA